MGIENARHARLPKLGQAPNADGRPRTSQPAHAADRGQVHATASFREDSRPHAQEKSDATVIEQAQVVCSSRWAVDGAPVFRCNRDELVALLPFPAEDANKYTRGKLTLIAGSERYPGAACLAANAAQRMGAGYVEVVTVAGARPLVLATSPSLVVTLQDKWDTAGVAAVKEGKPQAVCVGPGFVAGSKRANELVFSVLHDAACPVLVDGGALAALSTKRGFKLLKRRFERGWRTVATPHGGEAARLAEPFGIPAGNLARLASLLSLVYGFTAVVKGPDTFVSDGDVTFEVTEGTCDLAKAGTGDVLAGMVSSLLAQGISPVQAGVLGATLHARAGVLAGCRQTTLGVRAEDVAAEIPAAIVELVG